MNSKLKNITIFSALVLLCGCTTPIPEGDIKDFVMEIDYENTYKNVNSGHIVIESKHHENDESIFGSVKIESDFYKNEESKEYYYYCLTTVTGNYYGTEAGQYNFHSEEVLVYTDQDENIKAYKKTNGENVDFSCALDELLNSIKGCFYLEVTSGFHSGGTYYGDYVLANCGRYYNYFSLNDNKDILSYDIKTSSYDGDGNKIYAEHNFKVDKYGMLLDLYSMTKFEEKVEKIVTTINGSYNNEIKKLENL